MKSLKELLQNINIKQLSGELDTLVVGVCLDSREVRAGTLFVAQRGLVVDGHLFIVKAIEKGASVIVCEEFPEELTAGITYVQVYDSREALGVIADNFYDHPSTKLRLIGVTGTNGKTTIATLLHQLFSGMGYKVGLLSTIVNKINHVEIPTTHTTPDALAIQSLLSEMVDSGCDYCFMEVSSHAVVQKRICGSTFFGGIFTNLSHDHLDFHKTFASYLEAKKTFFDNLPKTAFALTNQDDRNGLVMLQNTKAKKYSYGFRSYADFHGVIGENTLHGIEINLDSVGKVYTQLVGVFNAYNLLAIYSTAILCDIPKDEVAVALSKLQPAEGRFEHLSGGSGIFAIVDYAHTPDAIESILKTICETKDQSAQLITVVGCGGDRDAAKRPIMAQIAAKMSNKTILTSDNPRGEDPERIIDEMEEGVSQDLRDKVLRMVSRRDAIRTACSLAQAGDIVVVAGKGHEKYQEIKGERAHFDDKEELLKWI